MPTVWPSCATYLLSCLELLDLEIKFVLFFLFYSVFFFFLGGGGGGGGCSVRPQCICEPNKHTNDVSR